MQRIPSILAGAALGLLIGGCSPEPVATPTPESTPEPTPEPTASLTSSLNAELLDRRWTILFIGTDLNAARAERGEPVSTDAIMLVSLSADASQLAMVSLPRDTVDVPLPGGGTYAGKINGLYAVEDVGALVAAMEALYEQPIDGHVVLDMDDFTRLVQAVDGVEVSPEGPLADPLVRLDLDAGPQEIDAVTANGYVRTRIDQDYGRMGRQQEVLLAIVRDLTDPETDIDVRALLDGLDSLETDLPLDELPTLLELARRAADADLERVVIEPPLITFEGDRNDGRGYILEPDVEAIRSEVDALIGE